MLIIINALFAFLYAILYIMEAIRSFLDFQRLQFSQKVGHFLTMIMVCITLFVLLAKVSRQGGFSTQILLTALYNIYVWHLGILYMPSYKSDYQAKAMGIGTEMRYRSDAS